MARDNRARLIDDCDIDQVAGPAQGSLPMVASVDELARMLEEIARLRAQLGVPVYQSNRKLSRWVRKLNEENEALRCSLRAAMDRLRGGGRR